MWGYVFAYSAGVPGIPPAVDLSVFQAGVDSNLRAVGEIDDFAGFKMSAMPSGILLSAIAFDQRTFRASGGSRHLFTGKLESFLDGGGFFGKSDRASDSDE